jgi:intracellular septation protein A
MVSIAALVSIPVLALAWLWRPRRPLAPGIRILLGLYTLLGLGCLLIERLWPGGAPALLARCEPTLLYWSVAVVLGVSPLLDLGYPAQAMVGGHFNFNRREWQFINFMVLLACLLLGALNLYIGLTDGAGGWEGFKYACMVNVFGALLLRATFVWVDLAVRIVRHGLARWQAWRRT